MACVASDECGTYETVKSTSCHLLFFREKAAAARNALPKVNIVSTLPCEQGVGERETKRYSEIERKREIETERYRDRDTEIERDREIER